MIKTFSLLIFIFLSTLFHIKAQSSPENAIQKFSENYPQEKFHILLNKKSFVAGEQIYFKCFVIDGFKPSSISTSLFVELYDKNKKIIEQKTVPVLMGEAFGNISLPADLKENVYFLRVYSTWSTNFSEKFQGIKTIPIYNPASAEKLILNNNAAWKITVHPEGGSLLNKVETKVAVRMHSAGALPSNWSGYIIAEKNSTQKIAEFKSLDENVASFTMKPELNIKYQMIVTDGAGTTAKFDLPLVQESGVSLEVESKNGLITYTPKFRQMKRKSSYYRILGQINNTLVYKAKVNNLISGESVSIPTKTLVNGIMQLVVMDDQDQVMAERLFFVDSQALKFEKVQVQKSKLDNQSKSLNIINVSAKSPFINYSALVTDASIASTEDDNSLLSSIWLTGDIRTEISRPAQYFLEDKNPFALDALLMTETWERFKWQQILTGHFPIIKNKPAAYISYKGKASVDGEPAKNKTINLLYEDKNIGLQYHEVKTDSQGLFVLDQLIFEDPVDVHYQIESNNKNKQENNAVYFQPQVNPDMLISDLPTSPYILSSTKYEVPESEEISRAVQDITFNAQYTEKISVIEEVIIRARYKVLTEKLNKKLSGPTFRTINEKVFDFVNDDTPKFGDILNWLEGRVVGLKIIRKGFDRSATIKGATVLLYVNEFKQDFIYLENIDIENVAMIKVISPPFQGGFAYAISIYLKDSLYDTEREAALRRELSSLSYKNLKGYDKNVAFPLVNYQIAPAQKLIKDTRLTLYWNPYLISNKEGIGEIQFYNNDIAKKYNMTILGYDTVKEQYIYFNEEIEP